MGGVGLVDTDGALSDGTGFVCGVVVSSSTSQYRFAAELFMEPRDNSPSVRFGAPLAGDLFVQCCDELRLAPVSFFGGDSSCRASESRKQALQYCDAGCFQTVAMLVIPDIITSG
jgi:hypothetical protein